MSVIANVQVMEILQRFEQKGYKLVAAKVTHSCWLLTTIYRLS